MSAPIYAIAEKYAGKADGELHTILIVHGSIAERLEVRQLAEHVLRHAPADRDDAHPMTNLPPVQELSEDAVTEKPLDLVREFVEDYEWRGDEGDHTPNEAESALIEDAIQGFIGLLQDRGYLLTELQHSRAAEAVGRAALIAKMVDRFLQWRLPADFNPDGGITFVKEYGQNGPYPGEHKPVGTNLLSATQAKAMVDHMLAGLDIEDADEAYELGKRDGYEEAIQELDVATGGDGEFKGSTFPGDTVDVPVMRQRIIDRFAASPASPSPATGVRVSDEVVEQLVVREARRIEILNWLQEEIGTGWTCDNCGYCTYHSNANECADCGALFPTEHLLAFKLHATATEDADLIAEARAMFAASGLIVEQP